MMIGVDLPTEAQWSYCINPACAQRLNPAQADHCQTCGTSLVVGDRYRLLRPLRHLSATYLTEVFEVADLHSGDRKVLKTLLRSDRKLVELFEREATVLKRLNHPGIPKIDSLGCFQVMPAQGEQPIRCLVMQRIDGTDLQRWMVARDPISQTLAIAWLRQLTEILHQIHQNHLFHRDIKPANIMLCPEAPWGRLVLIDFGTAREVTGTVVEGRDATVVYSDGYTAPEQLRGRATPQSDFYALGRTFIHLLTQTHPNDLPEDELTHNLIWSDRALHVSPLLVNVVSDLADESAIARPRNSQDLLDRIAEVEAQLRPRPIFGPGAPHEAAPGPLSPESVTDLDATRPPLEDWTVHEPETRLQPNSRTLLWWQSHRPWLMTCSVLVMLLGLLLISWGRREGQRRQILLSQRLLAQAEVLQPPVGQQLETSLLLSLEAWHRLRSLNFPTLPAEQLIQSGLSQLPRSRLTLDHDNDVNGVQLSPTGQFLVTASSDGTAQLWQVGDQPAQLSTLQHGDSVTAIAFSPDERYLASASRDGSIQIWQQTETQRYELRHELNQGEPVLHLAIDVPSQRLITAGPSTITVWDLAQGSQLGQHRPAASVTAIALHPQQPQVAIATGTQVDLWTVNGAVTPLAQQNSTIQAIAFSPDGSRLVTGSSDHTARLWQVATGEEVRRWLHRYGVVQVVISDNGRYVATGTGSPLPLRQDHTAQVWDMDSGAAIAQVVHQGSIMDLAFSAEGTRLATASFDGTAKVWDIPQQEWVSHVHQSQAIVDISFTADGRSLATASLDNTAHLWELTGNPALTPIATEGDIQAIAFDPTGEILAVSTTTHLSLWRGDGTVLNRWASDRPIRSIQFRPDGQQFATLSADAQLQLWDRTTGALPVTFPHPTPITAIAFSPDGRVLATASTDNTARLWEASTGLELARLEHDSFVEAIAFSPDGRLVATASLDNTARLWEWQLPSPRELARLEHDSFVEAIAFSPDGRLVATASLDNTARLWDWQNPNQPERQRLMHTDDVKAIAFSPDGQFLVTTSGGSVLQPAQNDQVQVWDVAQGRSLFQLRDHAIIATGGFSADSQYLATISRNHGVQIWQILQQQEVARLNLAANSRAIVFHPQAPQVGITTVDNRVWLWSWRNQDLIQHACDRLSRSLSQEDWSRYLGQEPYRPTCRDRA